MKENYFPYADDAFEAWLGSMASHLPSVMAALGLPATFDDEFQAARTAFSTALADHHALQASAHAARQEKEDAKRMVTDKMRRMVRQLRANPTFDDAEAALIGLPPLDRIRTPIKPGRDVPFLSVEGGQSQHHTVRVMTVTEEGDKKRARPAWARGAVIVRAITEYGADVPERSLREIVGVATRGRLEIDYPGEHIGKVVWYSARWETPTGELGLWSNDVPCMVTS